MAKKDVHVSSHLRKPRAKNDVINEHGLMQKIAPLVNKHTEKLSLTFDSYNSTGVCEAGLLMFYAQIELMLMFAPQGLPNWKQIVNVLTALQNKYKVYGEKVKKKFIEGQAIEWKKMCKHIRMLADLRQDNKTRRNRILTAADQRLANLIRMIQCRTHVANPHCV